MSEVRTGGCQCGEIRYRIEGPPLAVVVCHCTECQRQSGSAFAWSVFVSKAEFQLISGEPTEFSRDTNSGRVGRFAFCPKCGTTIFGSPPYAEALLSIRAGSLDDNSGLEPEIHGWIQSKQPWVTIPDGVKCFERQPQ